MEFKDNIKPKNGFRANLKQFKSKFDYAKLLTRNAGFQQTLIANFKTSLKIAKLRDGQ